MDSLLKWGTWHKATSGPESLIYAADALKPFATQITISTTDDSVDAEVKLAEERLTKSLEGLGSRLNAKSGRLTAKLMNIAADLLDTL